MITGGMSLTNRPAMTIIQKAIGILRKYGTNAHIFIPGVGTLSGITAGNYLDSAGTTAASVDNPVGLVVDPFGSVNATQATTSAKPILRLNSGKYSWQFDGSNDSLSLSAPLFQMSDDHCVIAGVNTLHTNDYILNFGSGAASQHIAALYMSGSVLAAAWVDDAATVASVSESSASLGVSKVACAVKIGNAKRLRVNGVQQGATNNTVLGVTTVSTGFIGGFKSGSLPFSGSLYPVIAIKGTVTDSDLLTLERFVGQLSGVSI